MSAGKARIALLLPDLDIGGAQRALLVVARELLDAGYEVDIVSLTKGGKMAEECPPGARCRAFARTRLPGPLLFCVTIGPLLHYLSRERPQAVLSTITGCNLLACVAQALTWQRRRLVVREAVSLRNASRGRRWAVRWLYRSADEIVALSESLAGEMQALGLSSARIHVVPNPVDSTRIGELAKQPLPDMPAGKPFVACIGRLVEQKNHASALQAFAASGLRHSHVLAIAGEGPLREELYARALALGLQGSVAWLGEVRNPYPLIAHAEAVLLTSRWEGSPNVVLEAMALGTPVIATDVPGGVRELLAGASGHRLVPPGNVQAIGNALESIVAEGGRVPVLAPAAREPARVAGLYLKLLIPGVAA